MKVIVLTGPHSCGKTTTLTLAHDVLINNGAQSTCKTQEGGNPNDFSDILQYDDGKKVGYLTMGDYAFRVIEFLQDCERQGCHVFVCACNNRFKRPFNLFAQHTPTHILQKVKAANSSLESSENLRDANHIVSLV